MQFPQKHPQQHTNDMNPKNPTAIFSATGAIFSLSGMSSSYNTIEAGLRTQQLIGRTTYVSGNPRKARHHLPTTFTRDGFGFVM
jgi:hypothetical protein